MTSQAKHFYTVGSKKGLRFVYTGRREQELCAYSEIMDCQVCGFRSRDATSSRERGTLRVRVGVGGDTACKLARKGSR